MGGMNKKQFLARLKEKPGFKTEVVELPEFGEVTLRQLDPAMNDELGKLSKETDEEKMSVGLACMAVSIIDPETNEPMFSPNEARQILFQLNPNAAKKLMEAFKRLNNLEVDIIEKNSEASPNLDLVTA